MIRSGTTTTLLVIWVVVGVSLPAIAADTDENTDDSFFSELPIEVHGFYEIR